MATAHSSQAILVATLWVALSALGTALVAAEPQPQRARPPQWSADVLDIFFANADEALEGSRPDFAAATSAHNRTAPDGDSTNATAPGSTNGAAWSKIIAAETIETEVKRLSQAINRDVTTPGPFKAGGFQACRKDFSLLALLFAVAAEYDGDVRWKDVAAGLREQFARAGHNCKVGTDQTYQEASRRKQELADLISGARPQVPSADRTVDNWADVADRTPLMQRMNTAQQERLTKWLANEREFSSHADDVRHEAQLLATIAAVIVRKEFDYWDDEQFAGYAQELQQAATDIAAAAEQGDLEHAQQAAGRATKACADCHDGYRG